MGGSNPLEDEFRDFVTARSAALLRTAYLLTGDWGTAEDLLQTALTKTYLAWKRLGGIEAIEPYARRVMVNTSTSWWRRRWHGERPTEVLPERAAADTIEQQLDRDVLWRHLRALPARQRAVLVLRYYEDMSEAQTAALLEISPGTVKSQTSRALATLRRRLGAEEAAVLPGTATPPAEPAARRTGRPAARSTSTARADVPPPAARADAPPEGRPDARVPAGRPDAEVPALRPGASPGAASLRHPDDALVGEHR
ncbi:SigE family RNA polymerase sigma factor [Micromonospora sp. NPDC049900]|uniref:SigE family RNA polymerase sigma factor n=1 Tax=Micromonospora sp. NPDC049900 TaxID=3364275 RepID=UPI0037AC32A7